MRSGTPPPLRWGWDGVGVCPPPVLRAPEAASPEVLWQTRQVVSGSPRTGLGATTPPQTLGGPGAVKPDKCPCPWHVPRGLGAFYRKPMACSAQGECLPGALPLY